MHREIKSSVPYKRYKSGCCYWSLVSLECLSDSTPCSPLCIPPRSLTYYLCIRPVINLLKTSLLSIKTPHPVFNTTREQLILDNRQLLKQQAKNSLTTKTQWAGLNVFLPVPVVRRPTSKARPRPSRAVVKFKSLNTHAVYFLKWTLTTCD